MSDYDLVIDNKHYDLKWTNPKPPTQKDIEGIVAQYRAKVGSKPPVAQPAPPQPAPQATTSAQSSPLELKYEPETPHHFIGNPRLPSTAFSETRKPVHVGSSIGPQAPAQPPNMLQRAVDAAGKVVGYPADVVKAGVLLPAEEKFRQMTPNTGVDTRTPRDKARVKQLMDMPLLKRASAVHGDPLRSIGQPDLEAQRQVETEKYGPIGHAFDLIGGTAADLATDPMTYLASAGLAKAPAKVGKAISGAFAGQMIAPYMADPSKIKDDPEAFLLHLAMAGTAATHALGHVKIPEPTEAVLNPRKFERPNREARPDNRESPLRTQSVKPTKSPRLRPEVPARTAKADATHRANLLKQDEAARTAQENAEAQARRAKANPQAKPQRARPVDPKQAEAKAKAEAQARADAEYAAWTRQHPIEAAGPVKPIEAKPRAKPADTFPRTIGDRYGVPRTDEPEAPPDKGGSAPVKPAPVQPKPPEVAKSEPPKVPESKVSPAKWTPRIPTHIGEVETFHPPAGKTVDGLKVRSSIPNMGSIDSTLDNPISAKGIREVPMTDFEYGHEPPEIRNPAERARTEKLANEIKESGEINPLIVAYDSEGPYILEGGHRWDALRMLGKTSFPAHVVFDADVLKESPAAEKPHAALPDIKPAAVGKSASAPSNVRVAQGQAFVKLAGGGEMKVDLPENPAAKTKAIRDLQAKYDNPQTPRTGGAGTRTGSRTSGKYRFGYLEGSPADEFARAKQEMAAQIAEAAGAASKELPKVVGAAGASQQRKQGENNAAKQEVQQRVRQPEHPGGEGSRQGTEAGRRDSTKPATEKLQGQEKVGAGIRHETLQAIAKKYGLPEIPRGPGTSTKEMVEFGQEAIKHGADPEAHLQAALGRGPVSGFSLKESAAVVRAHLEHLQSEVNRLGDEAEDHHQLKGLAESAKSKYQDFAEKSKEIGTEVFHGVGMTMQGETDIDTGSFTAVRRAYQERNEKTTGRAELTPFEIANAKRLSTNVKDAKAEATKAADALNTQMKGEAVKQGKARSEKVPSDPIELGEHLAKKLAAYQKRKIERGAVGASSRPNPAWSAADRAAIWDHAKANYIDAGHDYESTLRNTATDLGISADDVRRIFESDTRTRRLTADFFAAMSKMRTAQRKAQSFIDWGNKPVWERRYDMTFGIPRNIKIYGHGGVMMTTHAGPNLFDPMTTGGWFRNFGRSWQYWLGNPKFYEAAMMKIERDPLFPVMDKAGLAVNPNKSFDDYHMWEGISDRLSGAKNAIVSGIGRGIEKVGGPFIRFGEAGNRGADALKMWRSETFKKIWFSLPKSIKDPGFNNKLLRAGSRKLKTASDDIRNDGMAEQIAEWVNHASGHGDLGKAKEIGGKILFSSSKFPSTWARVVGDPIKTINGVRKMALGTSTPEEAYMTTFRVKRAMRLSSVFLGTLYANDKFQEARKSSNRVNFTQPWKSDWLHFKAGDRQLDPTGGTLGPLHLLGVVWGTAQGKMPLLHGAGTRESGVMAGVHYAEGQLTPGVDIALEGLPIPGLRSFGEDYLGRPMPWSNKPGSPAKPKYTYREWLMEQTPIPVQESVQSVYDDYRRHGMSESEADKALGAVYAFGLAMAGVRDMPATRPAPVRLPAMPRNRDIPRTRIDTKSDFKD